MEHQRKLNILIVDDSLWSRELVKTMVEECGHCALTANGHVETLTHLSNSKVDLILMDIEMPDVNGFELTSMIRQQLPDWFPIIFLSANDSEEYLAQGIDAGGDDYLTKPVKKVILAAKIRAMGRIATMQAELDGLNKQLEILSSTDPLTQLVNRRTLEQLLVSEWANFKRNDSEFSILMLDIDFFKSYNDNYGHVKGDECLQQFANILLSVTKKDSDVIARYGGEEFVIVLPDTPLSGARFKANEIIKVLSEARITHDYSDVANYLTASIGLTSTINGAHNYQHLIEQADLALYKAKNAGRNQVKIFENR